MKTKLQVVCLWLALALACLARFVHLDADPKFENWIFYVQDEGRWVETARSLALFGDPGLYDISRLHFVLSTGFQAVTFVVFELVGVNLWSARLWSAIAGAAILVVTVLLLRRRVPFFPLMFGVVILALDPLTLSLGRTAIPEVSALLFTLLAFVVLCLRPGAAGAALGGLAIAVATSMKGTTVLLLPVFVAMATLSGRQAGKRAATFLAGFLVPVLAGVAMAAAAGIVRPDSLAQLTHVFGRFFDYGNVYQAASRLFLPEKIQHFTLLLLLGAWLGSWLLVLRREFIDSELGRIYLLSAVWALGWMAIWYLMNYAPERYWVHLILPLVIHIVAALGLWRQFGAARVLVAVEQRRAQSGFAFHLWLVLPSAVFVSEAGLTMAAELGSTSDRLILRISSFAAAALALTVLAKWRRAVPRSSAAWLSLPVALALLGLLFEGFSSVLLSKPASRHAQPLVNMALLLVVGACAWRWRRSVGAGFGRPATAWCAFVLVGVALVCESWPILTRPTYSIRTASRTIGQQFADATLLQSSGAGLLMLENGLRYRDAVNDGRPVDAILDYDRRVRVPGQFIPWTSYRLTVHQRYDARSRPHMDGGDAMVDVYRNSHLLRPGEQPPAAR